MNTATLHISRNILGQTEDKGETRFQQGDYYNIYHGTGASAGLGEENEMIKKFCAFKVASITSDSVKIELIYPAPPEENFSLKIDGSKEVEFGEYGIYSITLKSVE